MTRPASRPGGSRERRRERNAGFGDGFQLLLGHTKLESTALYLGIEVDDALVLSEQVDL